MFSGHSVNGIRFTSARRGSSFSGAENNSYEPSLKRKHSFGKTNITNMSNDQIIISSLGYAEEKSNQTLAGKISNALPMLFLVAIPAVLGITQKGNLSSKVKTGLLSAAALGGIDFIFNKYNNAVDRVENASPNVKNYRDKHPNFAFSFDFIAPALLALTAYAGLGKGAGYLQGKFAPSYQRLVKSVEKASSQLDATKVGVKVAKASANFADFMNKHPKLAEFTQKSAILKPLAIVLGWSALSDAVEDKVYNDKLDFAAKRMDLLFSLREQARNSEI